MPKPQHAFMGASLNGLLVRLFIERAKCGKTEVYLQQERAHLEQSLQPLHPSLANNLNNYALLYIAQGKYNQAVTVLRQSLNILEQSVGLRHSFSGNTLHIMGRLCYY